jgi:hypothetical protein
MREEIADFKARACQLAAALWGNAASDVAQGTAIYGA